MTGLSETQDDVDTIDGSASSPAWTFDADSDTGVYRNGADDIRVVTNGTDGLVIGSSQTVDVPSGNLELSGNELHEVGGTSDATTGAIRMANNTGIFARNSGGGSDVEVIKLDSGDNIRLGNSNSSNIRLKTGGNIRFEANPLIEIGGTTDASAGDVRLAHGSTIQARNNGNGADIVALGVGNTTNDEIDIGNSNVAGINIEAGTGVVDVTGGDLQTNGNNADLGGGEIQQHRIDRQSVVTSNTTVSTEGVLQPADTSGGAITITLASSMVADGAQVMVADEGGSAATNSITIDTESSETINGSSSVTIDQNHGSVILYSDGTNWFDLAVASGSLL